MKLSLALRPRRPLDRPTAWGCVTSNFALPGLGSLIAGRAIGYGQAALALSGLSVTFFFGGRFMLWMLRNWDDIQRLGETDFGAYWQEIWVRLRPPLLGLGLFALGLLWALVTSLSILREAKPPPPIEPPRISKR